MNVRPREKRFIAAAVIAGVLFLLLDNLVLPWWERQDESAATLQLAQKTLRRQRDLLAASSHLQEQVNALGATLQAHERGLLQAPDPEQGGAELQAWLVQQATGHQLEVMRSEFLPPSALQETYLRVPLQVELRGRMTNLANFLATVLDGERVLALERLQISAAAGGDDKQVRCLIVITGLMVRRA